MHHENPQQLYNQAPAAAQHNAQRHFRSSGSHNLKLHKFLQSLNTPHIKIETAYGQPLKIIYIILLYLFRLAVANFNN